MPWIERGVLKSEVVKYTNVVFGTDESDLFIEVSLIQGCPYRVVPLWLKVIQWQYTMYIYVQHVHILVSL